MEHDLPTVYRGILQPEMLQYKVCTLRPVRILGEQPDYSYSALPFCSDGRLLPSCKHLFDDEMLRRRHRSVALPAIVCASKDGDDIGPAALKDTHELPDDCMSSILK